MTGPNPDDVLLFDGFRFDRPAGGLFRIDARGNADIVPLGSRALDLLALLTRRNGETVSKEEIMTVVWTGRAVEEANLNVQISKLRHILDQERPHGSCIQTVTGYGYRFVADVTSIPRLAPSRVIDATMDAGHGTVNPVESGAARAGDDDLAAALFDLRQRLLNDYVDGAAAMLLIEQVIIAYQGFLRVTGWITSLSTTIDTEFFGSDLSASHPTDQHSSSQTSTTDMARHLAQLHEGLVPLAEQYGGVIRDALAALEAFRVSPAKE
jgi:DNA-binding winged helix-turn-helix (wHTH) protein